MDPRDYATEQEERLRRKVLDLGANELEVQVAAENETWGPLALDLATRAPGPTLDLLEFARESGMDPDLVLRLWVALGLPLEGVVPPRVPPQMAAAMRLFGGMVMILDEPAVLGLARVIGQSVARLAEAVSDAFRVGTELPAISAGVSYADVVDGYASFTKEALPFFYDAVGAVFQRHLVVVSHQMWTSDEGGTTITRERTVGFADLVGSTEALLATTSVTELAAMVREFEALAWEVVAGAGGRVVQLIGDEVMFVFETPAAACAAAAELSGRSPHPVRVGLAHGAVVGVHGDYYGAPVNLAARLVRAAEPSTVVVSETVREGVSDFAFASVDLGPLKGFPADTAAFRLDS